MMLKQAFLRQRCPNFDYHDYHIGLTYPYLSSIHSLKRHFLCVGLSDKYKINNQVMIRTYYRYLM